MKWTLQFYFIIKISTNVGNTMFSVLVYCNCTLLCGQSVKTYCSVINWTSPCVSAEGLTYHQRRTKIKSAVTAKYFSHHVVIVKWKSHFFIYLWYDFLSFFLLLIYIFLLNHFKSLEIVNYSRMVSLERNNSHGFVYYR